jgi:hypothetical protein
VAKCTSSDEPQPHRHVTRRDSDAIRILSDCGLHVEVVELKPAWTPGLCDFYTQHSSLFSVVLSDTTRADTESGGDIRRRTRSGQGASCQLPGAWDSPPPARRSVTYCKCKRVHHRDRAAFFPHNGYPSLCPLACSHVHVQHVPRAAPAAQAAAHALLPQDRLKTAVPN